LEQHFLSTGSNRYRYSTPFLTEFRNIKFKFRKEGRKPGRLRPGFCTGVENGEQEENRKEAEWGRKRPDETLAKYIRGLKT